MKIPLPLPDPVSLLSLLLSASLRVWGKGQEKEGKGRKEIRREGRREMCESAFSVYFRRATTNSTIKQKSVEMFW